MKILKITNLKTGQVQQSDFKTITHPANPAVIDENGIEISPATPELLEVVPCEYVKEVIDTDAKEHEERTKKETKHTERLTRIEQLKAINWAEIDTVKELKEIVKLLAKEAIKDEE